jgi:EF hand domain-containing protein
MKKLLIISLTALFFIGCTTFGSFPNLKKGESSQDEVLSMLGDPAKKSFKDDKEVWSYQFIKKGREQAGNMMTLLNLDVSFKDKEVDNYDVTVSREKGTQGPMKGVQQGKPLPRPTGGQTPAAPGRGKTGNFIQELDRNGDGVVSENEFPGPAQVFKKMDKNGDGVIDQREAPKGKPQKRGQGKKW